MSPHNPFKTPIIVHNTGYLDIKNIIFSCYIEFLEDVRHNKIAEGISQPNKIEIPVLGGGEKSIIDLQRALSVDDLKKGTIRIELEYEPFKQLPYKKLHKHFHKTQRFTTQRNYKNELIWVPLAKSKPANSK